MEGRHEEQHARQPPQPHRARQHRHDHQQRHETQRIRHEHGVVIEVEASAEGKQQPHERHRDRDQQPAVLVGVGLELVGGKLGIGAELLERLVDLRDAAGAVPQRLGGHLVSCGLHVLHSAQGIARAVDLFVDGIGILALRLRRGLLLLKTRDLAVEALDRLVEIAVHRHCIAIDFHPFGRFVICHGVEHREHAEHEEQEQRDRRDIAGAPPVDVFAGQLARLPQQQRQRAPGLALEVEYAVQQIVPERSQRAVDVRRLPAGMAMAADQHGPAIEAGAFVRMAVSIRAPGLSRCRFDRAGRHCPLPEFRDAFPDSAHGTPLIGAIVTCCRGTGKTRYCSAAAGLLSRAPMPACAR